MQHIYLAPHFDDAVYSCGGAIEQQAARGESVLVITMFGGLPSSPALSPLAERLHQEWGLDRDAVTMRALEDRRALDLLGARQECWPFEDALYRVDSAGRFCYSAYRHLFRKRNRHDRQLVDALALKLHELYLRHQQGAVFYAPLALGGHVDHGIVREVAARLLKRGAKVFFYEDQPYVSEHPRAIEQALVPEPGMIWESTIVPIALERKWRAVECYISQRIGLAQCRDRMRTYTGSLLHDGRAAERLWRPVARPGHAEQSAARRAGRASLPPVENVGRNLSKEQTMVRAIELKQILPSAARYELRQIWYHCRWLAQALQQRRLLAAQQLAMVLGLRALEDLRRVLAGNTRAVECLICGWQGNRFYPYTDQGVGLWVDEICPCCQSLARHRLQWYYIREHLAGARTRVKILEIAPWGMRRATASLPNIEYVAIDIRQLPKTIRGDTTRLPFRADSFDIVTCFNVLCEVEDDIAAVAEMRRVCRPGGRILLSEPVGRDQHGERLATMIVFPSRSRGRHGALRWYGRDIAQHFSASGAAFHEDDYALRLAPEVVRRYGLSRRLLFVATAEPQNQEPRTASHRTRGQGSGFGVRELGVGRPENSKPCP